MKIRTALFFSGLITLGPLTAATTDPPAPAQEAAPAKSLDALVRELSNEDYKTRENASREIWKQAEKALPVLEEAAKSTDPEQAIRAKELLQKIRLEITPDTDPTVAALVERYIKATSKSEKATLFDKLRTKRAWLQLLRLFSDEKDEDMKLRLRPSISGIAVRAAREKLSEGKTEAAQAFLELAPEDGSGLLALAEFYRSQGKLEEELAKAKTLDGRRGRALHLALLRSAGDTRTAREIADEIGEPEIAASMAALSGDPRPWLKTRSSSDPLVSAYHFAATAKWNSGKVRPSDIGPLVDALASRDPSERDAAINALLLLGESQVALPVYIKSDPVAAFIDLEGQERVPEALKALGFDPEKPDYKPWVEKRFRQLTELDIEDQHEISMDDGELVLLAGFLERRGNAKEAFELYAGPAAALAEKDTSTFLGLVGRLAGTGKSQDGSPDLARRLGTAWAGDSDLKWQELVESIFGDTELINGWWDWLGKLAPESSRNERLDALFALFDVGKDTKKTRDLWIEKAWKHIKEANAVPVEKVSLIEALSMTVGDSRNFLKAWEMLPEENRNDQNWFLHIASLTNEDRWGDAADIILKQIAGITALKQPPGAEMHAYAAAALRRAGREQEAAEHDKRVNLLSLGESRLAIQIGHGYAFGGDYGRANEWWERAARFANPETNEFFNAISMILDNAHWMETGKWSEAASICEVFCAISASREYNWSKHLPLLRQRIQGDTARALSMLDENRERSLATLAKCHQLFLTDGSLADFFYPSLRRAGLMKEHDAWFESTWNAISAMARRYPESDNTQNTAAWLAARAMRHLDEAEEMLLSALAMRPRQPAYLDTMAEIQFAKGNREKAIEWSKTAVNYTPIGDRESDYLVLRRQLQRFQSDPLPKP